MKNFHRFITMALLKIQILKSTIFLFTEIFWTTSAQKPKTSSEGQLCSGECCKDFIKWQGNCIECPVGKYGIGCMENCPANYYGKLCRQRCDCEDGYFCSPINGCVTLSDDEFRCPTGKYGPICKLNCPQNRYGVNCSLTCTCETNQRCHVEHGCQNITATQEQTTIDRIGEWLKENITGIVSGVAGLVIGAAVVQVLLYAKRRGACNIGLNRRRVREIQPVRFFSQETYTIDPSENLAESVSENVAVSDRNGIYPHPHREIRVYGQYERNNKVECQDQGFMDNTSGGSYTEIVYDEPIRAESESCRLASARELGYSNDIIDRILKEPGYSNECWVLQMEDGTDHEVKSFLS